MHIEDFGVEIWMNAHENSCAHNLAETCVASLTLGELLDIAASAGVADAADGLEALRGRALTYGAIEGSDRLRTAIAALYEGVPPGRIVVTHGAIGANALVHSALVEPGDRVVVIRPTYQQHHSIPESLGAQVRTLWLREQDAWQPDLDELERLVGDRARLIAFANPNNPTGALMGEAQLRRIAEIADRAGAAVLADEVYRGVHQDDDELGPSMADVFARGISIGSMSKSFSLAGLRLGWIAGPTDVLERVAIHRDYTTISVGLVDDHLACLALEAREAILGRSRAIVRGNLAALQAWLADVPGLRMVRPQAGTTALLGYDRPVPSVSLCETILADTGVLFTPGSALGVEGQLRIGYANHPEILRAGLAALGPLARSW